MERKQKRILSVTVHRETETDPDLSWIGKYTDALEPWNVIATGENAGQFVIDVDGDDDTNVCVPRGNRYRAFKPYAGGERPGTDDYRTNGMQDYERMTAYNAGNWCMVGIWVTAEVQLASDIVQKVQSGGLWGIESDSDAGYFAEIEAEQLRELTAELVAAGFTAGQVAAAFENRKEAT